MIIWFTGLSGAGKSTVAAALWGSLPWGIPGYIIDGDDLRKGLCSDLDYTAASRSENIRRAVELAKIMRGAGFLPICTLISPFKHDRDMARLNAGNFVEVFIDTPLSECIKRDTKGLYANRPDHMTGFDSPYEPPEEPDVHIRTMEMSPDEAAVAIVRHICSVSGIPIPR